MAVTARKYVTRPNEVTAVQFNGKNSKELAQWIRDKGGEAQARGVYIVFGAPGRTQTIRKGDFVVLDHDALSLWSETLFKDTFMKKTASKK